MQTLRAFACDTRGTTAIEYGLIALLVSVAILAPLTWISADVAHFYDLLATAF